MYPIRTSRTVWTKNFNRPHVCSELCNTNYIISDNLIRISYQTGCLYPEKIEPAYIHLAEVNTSDAVKYIDEELPLPRRLLLCVEHPMRVPRMYEHVFDGDEPIRLSTLVQLFDAHYRRIYQEEEAQATPREFWISTSCTDCSEDLYSEANIDRFLQPCEAEHNEDECFCFNEMDDEKQTECVRVYKCQHRFHRSCLLRWFNTPRTNPVEQEDGSTTERKSNTCPNCRQPIIYCESCQSSGKIKQRFFGAVPPFNADLEDQEDRPETDGPYRIHTIYYEELFFKGIMYDSTQQIVRLLPLERVE